MTKKNYNCKKNCYAIMFFERKLVYNTSFIHTKLMK